ncbi:hypothetical protein A8C32_12415 [Flavivirga aquatica]|uniref:Uncharacterized protein n=1 Tax=Flavivirga aquatica TaxID=1849968 RepID=A0A1E5TDP8_9FLAO|nr:hypothetical protein [Flavivirga aquatica]OEK09506.1 hypothetical protein A8C32_12415 [Flavivirga aquatica]
MYKELIIEAFVKAKNQREKRGEKSPSVVAIAEDLSEYISEKEGFSLGERSFRDYKKEAEKLANKLEDINIKQFKVVIGLCKYLGYNDYEDFVSRNTSKIKKRFNLFKKNIISVSVVGISVLVLFVINSVEEERWMMWKEDHYIKVGFDKEKYDSGVLMLYDESRLKLLRIKADCNTAFFDLQGRPMVWYGKNVKKELQFFSAYGLHPETGKSLNPITRYMIRKYICKDY